MIYCNTCGQCKYIDDSNFVEVVYVSGTEKRYIDCETGDVNDSETQDMETGDSESFECPHCYSGDLDFEWEGTEEEAFDQRALHVEPKRRNQAKRDLERLNATIKDSDWDLSTNEVHK